MYVHNQKVHGHEYREQRNKSLVRARFPYCVLTDHSLLHPLSKRLQQAIYTSE
jgi:hypothetical protein